MHGRDPVLPVEAVMCPPTITYTSREDYKLEMVTRLQEAFTLAKDNLQTGSTAEAKEQYDLKSGVINYAIGEKIWVFNPNAKPGLSTQLLHNWHGPYIIIDKLSDVIYKIQMCDSKKSEQTVHVNRIKLFVDPDDRPITDEGDIGLNIDSIENNDNTMVGGNDLSSENEPVKIARDISVFADYIINCYHDNHVVIGQLLPRYSERPEAYYNNKVYIVNKELSHLVKERDNATFWHHRGLWKNTPDLLLKDKVHLNDEGMEIYARSVRAAVGSLSRTCNVEQTCVANYRL
ncbi:unnamed protein product [Mytilus edulis]|uniref:Integrase p58-like C-terminal domain-containing protein n=1 Tax=Mytilus edulis TaxID=6550 RepID=A0A8S3S8X6_MYTED|nr:unnamed protein product [Mytilus edulis]